MPYGYCCGCGCGCGCGCYGCTEFHGCCPGCCRRCCCCCKDCVPTLPCLELMCGILCSVLPSQIRVEVRKLQQQKNLSDEQALQIFQQNFEHSLDQLIAAIRNQYKVTEKAMDTSFKEHQSDPEVQQAIQSMRMLSAASSPAAGGSASGITDSAAGTARSANGSGASANSEPKGSNGLPESLTKRRLKEIMTFNAVMLEKELRPIKEKVEQLKKEGQANNLDPQLLMQVQMRISQAVQERFGVTDEQVMAAVDLYGAKSDPGFKDILQRIATTLSTSLG